MRVIKYLLLIGLVVMVMPAFALRTNEVTEEKYLIDHGHSDEIVRMMELQKSRLEINNEEPIKEEPKTFWGKVGKHMENSRITKFCRNLIYERDVTMPTEKFGQDRVRTVESPNR